MDGPGGVFDSGLPSWCILDVDGNQSVVELVKVWHVCIWIAGMANPVLSACHSYLSSVVHV